MDSSLLSHPYSSVARGPCLARVVSVEDPENLARVQIRLYSHDGPDNQDAPLWARVATPFAGNNRGAFLLPDVGDEVLVSFVNDDPRQPVVIGGLWNGAQSPPESPGGDRMDRWTLVGKAGTRIAIIEASDGEPTIRFSTPGGVSGELSDSGGGTIELQAAGNTVTIDSSGVSVQSGGSVQVQASQVDVSAGQVSVNAAVSSFSGVVRCDVLQATTVVATTYTPGAGNVW